MDEVIEYGVGTVIDLRKELEGIEEREEGGEREEHKREIQKKEEPKREVKKKEEHKREEDRPKKEKFRTQSSKRKKKGVIKKVGRGISKVKNLGKILWESKDDIEPLRKKKKSRKSVFGGKRDFKAIFKKFLKID